jgi:glycosyltransferase involved in cell wall biosynthesis
MKLGFHYHIPAYEKDGKIYTSGFLGLFLDSLAVHVEELVCFMHTPLPSEIFIMDYHLRMSNTRLVSMGQHSSLPLRLLSSKRIINQLAPELKSIDILLLRSPTPLLPALGRVPKLKKALLIVGDYQKSSKDSHLPFLRRTAIQLWAAIYKRQQDKVIRDSVVFVNSGVIFKELKDSVRNLHQIRTTTLQSSDFFYREDTCQSEIVNILYAGRLDLSKGLKEMIESLGQLRTKGINANLNFVGWEERNSTFVTDLLKNRAKELGLDNYVHFHGKKKVGEELNLFYRMADIYIIGSRENEGFPRTIWEAFANSTPVIASAVGSIPVFLRNEIDAIFIKPRSVEEMTGALIRLVEDGNLRRLIMRNAYEIAKKNTLESQAKIMIKILYENLYSQ